MIKNIREFFESYSEGLSDFEKRVMIDEMISELREIKGNLTEGSFVERQTKRKVEISRFFEDISSLRVSEKVVLKRGLGVDLGFEGMYRLLSNNEHYTIYPADEKIWALCARIYCLYDGNQSDKSFASCLGEEINSASGIAKFENMLNTSTDKFEYLSADLIRFVRQLKSKNKAFDCEALLLDMLNWNYASHSTQMTWAREFYASQAKKSE